MFRTTCRDEDLDLVSRVQILHIIELRAAGWQSNDNMVAYYKQKLSHIEISGGMRDSPQIHTAPVRLRVNTNIEYNNNNFFYFRELLMW